VFDWWKESALGQKRTRNVGQKVIWKLKNKAIVQAFDLWKSNFRSMKQMSRELGQNARFFCAAVRIL